MSFATTGADVALPVRHRLRRAGKDHRSGAGATFQRLGDTGREPRPYLLRTAADRSGAYSLSLNPGHTSAYGLYAILPGYVDGHGTLRAFPTALR